MRRPRLLALLILLAALLALGAWTLMHERPAAVENALASAPEAEAARDALLAVEPEALPQRQEASEGSAVAVPLANSDRIRGRVVRGRDAIPVAGVEVRCWMNLPPTRIEGPVRFDSFSGRLFSQGGPLPESTSVRRTSAPDGRFEFPNLDRGARYVLEARGSGWTLVERLVDLAPSEEECTLVVQRIYVARVLATDEQGVPPETSCQYLRYARVAGPGDCASLPLTEPPPSPSKKIQLPAGVDPLPGPPGERYAFTSDCDSPRLGPFRILICCAGFQRQDFEFWAYPEGMDGGVTEFRLQRVSDQAGTLRVVQDCGCKGSICEHLLEGELHLESVDGSQKPLEFELTGLAREQVFADLPVGSWRLRVRARNGGFCYPGAEAAPMEVTIGAEPAVVQLPVASLGMIRWSLRGPGEVPVGRPLELNWQGSGPGETATLWTSLVMRGVESGPRVFELSGRKFDLTETKLDHVEGARDVSSGEQMRIEVDVLAGETRTVVVH